MTNTSIAAPYEWGVHPATDHEVGAEQPLVVNRAEVDPSATDLIGGKVANLAVLVAVDGIAVPAGFCITKAAYDRIVGTAPGYFELLGPTRRDPRPGHRRSVPGKRRDPHLRRRPFRCPAESRSRSCSTSPARGRRPACGALQCYTAGDRSPAPARQCSGRN